MSLHFDNTCENGINQLSVYVSSDDASSELTHRNAYFSTDIDNEALAKGLVWPEKSGQTFLDMPLPTPPNEPYDLIASGDIFSSNWAGIPPYSGNYMTSLPVSPQRDFITPSNSSTSMRGISYASSASSSSTLDLDSSRLFKRRTTQSTKGRSSKYSEKEDFTRTKEKQQFTCSFDGCLEAFSRKHDGMRHEVTRHGRLCEWACDQCRKFFATEKTLAKHKCTSRVGDTRWVVP